MANEMKGAQQEALNDFCKTFNVKREADNDAARIHPALLLEGRKDRNALMKYGVSLNKGRASENNDIPMHLFFTTAIVSVDKADHAAGIILAQLNKASSTNSVSKLAWTAQGEARMSNKRWDGDGDKKK